MEKKRSKKKLIFFVWIALIAVILAAVIVLGPPNTETESIKEVMKDGVLHEKNKVSFFGIEVNPGLISAYTVTGILLFAALLIRIFAIPRFKYVPGKFQTALEKLVEFFLNMAKANSPHKTGIVATYIFSAGMYVFFGTLFELFGIQAITTKGISISLSAPLADINGAIAMGVTSYLFLLISGFVLNGVRGGLSVLKDFSLPISMSFRLFGALLSGLLVTELVYHYFALSFVLPVVVGIMFTLLHAVIQTYVLVTLVSVFFGEAVEPRKKKKETQQLEETI